MCDLPPCPPCPPPPYPPCPQVCTPPQPPLPPCRPKPIMRGLHWAQTKRKIAQALALSVLSGASVFLLLGMPRRQAYKDYYAKGEFEDYADDMARKGLFQSVPADSLQDNTPQKK